MFGTVIAVCCDGSQVLMFRITEQQTEDRTVLKLEGRLAADVVTELDACWRAVMENGHGRAVWVDLSHADLVDAAAQEQLARMYRAGVRFVTRGCFTRELVREISECR
jgi:anti-anti-sigma regulatory factor